MRYQSWPHAILLICSALLMAMSGAAEPKPQTILIRYQDQAAQVAASQADPSLTANLVRRLSSMPMDIVKVAPGSTMADSLARYRGLPGVSYVEASGDPLLRSGQSLDAKSLVARPAGIASTGETELPNDPLFDQQYALRNLGQTGGTPGADIGVSQVWPISTGSHDIVVAVIGTGINFNHPDLSPNIWVNEEELNGLPGVDDDDNGVVDDLHGASFIETFDQPPSGDSMDYEGSGTAAAAIIGAATNNGQGMAGVAWEVQLMGLSFTRPTDIAYYAVDVIGALDYAITNGAQVCLLAAALSRTSQGMMDLQEAARAKGVVVVCPSPGNVDGRGYFPLAKRLENVIGVGGSDQDDHLSPRGAFGYNSVDLAAPATDILTILDDSDSGYGKASGSLMAAAHVTGAVVLTKAIHPDATPAKIKEWLVAGARHVPSLAAKFIAGGRLDLVESLRLAALPPDILPVTNLSLAVNHANRQVTLDWALPNGVSPDAIIVSRSLTNHPNTPDEGTVIYEGLGTSVSDDLRGTDNRYVFYSVWARYGGVTLSLSRVASACFVFEGDDFANAVLLTGEAGTTIGNNLETTRELDEPEHNTNVFSFNSIWWKWVAPRSGYLRVSTYGSEFGANLVAYQGPSLSQIQELSGDSAVDEPFAEVTFKVIEGETYYLSVSPYVNPFIPAVWNGQVRLNWKMANDISSPANDDIEMATVLSPSGTLAGNNYAATEQDGEPDHSGFPGHTSVWFRWTAPANGGVYFTSYMQMPSTMVFYKLRPGNNLSLVATSTIDSNATGDDEHTAYLNVFVGDVFYLVIDGWNGAEGKYAMSWNFIAAQVNDSFAQAKLMEFRSGAFRHESNLGATKEPGEPDHADLPGTGTLWYRWRPPTDGLAEIRLSKIQGMIAVYQGNSLANLVEVASLVSDFGAIALTLEVSASVEYRIVVDSYGDPPGEFALDWWMNLPPGNDNFAQAWPLRGESGTEFIISSVDLATREPGEPNHAGRTDTNTVWYRYDAPRSGELTMGASTYFFANITVAAYEGNDISSLTELASVSGPADSGGQVTIPIVAGHSYYLVVASSIVRQDLMEDQGWFGMFWRTVLAPENDNFANATVIPSEGFHQALQTAPLIYATREAGEPQHMDKPGGHSFWYAWTAPGDGEGIIRTSANGENTLDWQQAIYQGDSLNALVPVATTVEVDGTANITTWFSVSAGQRYVIAVDSSHAAYLSFALQRWFIPAQSNNSFTNARNLDGASGSITGTTAGADHEACEPVHVGTSSGGASVWFKWLAPVGGTVTFSTADASTFDTLLAAYQGTSLCDDLTARASNDDFVGHYSQVSFQVTGGQTYWLAVDGVDGARGDYSLTWSLFSPLISVSAGPAGAEPGAVSHFTLTRTGPTDQHMAVNLRYSGTATAGLDYQALPTVVTIPAGAETLEVPVTFGDDTLLEDTETLVITVTHGLGYSPGMPASATSHYADNEEGNGIMSVTPSQTALGTELLVRGRGFGTRSVSARLVELDSDRKRPRIIRLRVQRGSLRDDQVVVRALSGRVGNYALEIKPRGQQEPYIAHTPVSLMAPAPDEVATTVAPGDTVSITGQFFGSNRGQVYLQVDGEKRKKRLAVLKKEGWQDTEITFKLAKKVKLGSYLLVVRTKLGTVVAPGSLSID